MVQLASNEEASLDVSAYDPKVPLADPFPVYRALRQRGPVHWIEASKIWVVLSHALIGEVVKDDRTYTQAYERREVSRSGEKVREQPYFQTFRRMFFMMDGEDHRRVRPLFARWFMGPTRMNELSPIVDRHAAEVVDGLVGIGKFDIVKDFAYSFPLRIISEILGVQPEYSARIAKDVHDIVAVVESVPKGPEVKMRADAAILRLQEFFRELIKERRASMGDDLLSAMIREYDAGSFVDEQELLANILLMYFAGHETTTDSMSLAVLSLFRNPEQFQLLKRDRQLMRNAVDELIRYDGTAQGFSRSPSKDVTLAAKDIPAGSFILLLLGAANRDPAVFPDPEQLLLDRSTVKALSFGGGAHACIGNMLARRELLAGLSCLIDRLPNLTLETTEPPASAFKQSMTRGLLSLTANS